MQSILTVLLIVVLAGCTYKGQNLETYIEEPNTIITDPHYMSYQGQSDSLEKEYLNKKITYADYLEQKNVLDEKYTKEIQARDYIISSEK